MLEAISISSLLLVIAMLRKIVNILPHVFRCALRSKESTNLDSDVKSSQDRDITAAVLTIPFCLTISRYDILNFRFAEGMSEVLYLGIVIAVFIAYLLFRIFTSKLFHPRRHRLSPRVKDRSERTFFVMLSICTLTCSWIMSTLNAEPEIIRNTIIWISVAIYLLYLVRKFQIFTSYCSVFTSFLYLCALEIIPTGALVVTVVIF